jgi:GWxTD domain-containing protein
MRKARRISVACLGLVFVIGSAFASAGPLLFFEQKLPLAPKYKAWLAEEVVYIITTKEREIFQKLESDEDRDRFIEEFWKARDPTPGTPRNEFRDEHYRRIEFANKTFGRGLPFQGWRTQRGRIYIILGPPVDVQRFESGEIYPIELWYFQGNPALGQAPFFRLLFYKKGGGGDFELYHPLGNSPKELVAGRGSNSDGAAMEVLRQISLELAQSTYSLMSPSGMVEIPRLEAKQGIV